MGCSLEERHLLKVDPERALSMDFEMGDRQIQEFPRFGLPEGATFRLNSPRAAQWRGSMAQSREFFRSNVVVNGIPWFFFCIPGWNSGQTLFRIKFFHPVWSCFRVVQWPDAEGLLPMLTPVDPNPAISADILHRYGFHRQHCWVELSVQRLK